MRFIILMGLGFIALSTLVVAQGPGTGPARSVWEGVYTEEQSERGRAVYRADCAHCHGETLQGDAAPTLSGPFWAIWSGRTAAELFKVIRSTMPADGPDSLRPQQYADLVAYMFKMNQFPVGSSELASDDASLTRVRIETAPPGR